MEWDRYEKKLQKLTGYFGDDLEEKKGNVKLRLTFTFRNNS